MIELQKKDNGIVEPQRTLPLDEEYDVIVVGGGVAGIGAGIACSRENCKTLLIESTSALGGLATMGLVNIPLDYLSGIGAEMFDELKAVDGLWHRNSDPEKHKLVLDRMVRKYGCHVLLVTNVVDSIVKNGGICGVVTENKSGRRAFLAKRIIDCSGDADASHFAGVEVMQGRIRDGMSQACSIEFRLGGVDWDKYLEWKPNDPKWTKTIKQAVDRGDLPYVVDNHLNWITHVPGRPEHCGKDEVSICFAHSRKCFPLDTRDLTRMYLEGREQADFLSKFIKKNVLGFEDSYLIDTASLLGVRESRRIVGEYVLTAYDLASLRKFDDVITISLHQFDLHGCENPGNQKWAELEIDGRKQYVIATKGGLGTTLYPPAGEKLVNYRGEDAEKAEWHGPNPYHDIPFRSLIPEKVDNLLVAGRCLSADFMAQAGTRLIMACLAMGEAAGTAAALSLRQNIQPRKVDRLELQKILISNKGDIGQDYRNIPGVSKST